jgi:tetratricopeptide (TPR) repeat protein
MHQNSYRQSLTYSRSLRALTEFDRRVTSQGETVSSERVVEVLTDFLSPPQGGGGYVSGLFLVGRLVVECQITAAEFDATSVDREPQRELIAWLSEAHGEGEWSGLSSQATDFCLEKREWRQLALQALTTSDAPVQLSDDQLLQFARRWMDGSQVDPIVDRLRSRGLTGTAEEVFESYLQQTADPAEPVRILEIARELEFESEFHRRLKVSLVRWRPTDSVDRLRGLTRLGREAETYDEVLLAVNRWLRNRSQETVPEGREPIIIAGIEALLHRENLGDKEAINLYKEYLSPPESGSMRGVGPDLYDVAEAVGEQTVMDDVLSTYEGAEIDPTETPPREAELAAKVAEQNERMDRAFKIWETLLEATPTRERFRRAVENRIAVRRLETASDLVEELTTEVEDELLVHGYRTLIADARGDYRRVVDFVEEDESVVEPDAALADKVSRVYIKALSDLGRWDEMETFLDQAEFVDQSLRRFYLHVAKLMRFANEESDAVDGREAADILERLLVSPMTTEQLQLLLNLNIVRRVSSRIRGSFPEVSDRVDVSQGLVEILVSLHAERLIDSLKEAGVDTDEFERNLSETDLRTAGAQLLSTLDREARREGLQIQSRGGSQGFMQSQLGT